MELQIIKNNDDKDNVYIFTDENGTKYKVINPEFYARNKETGEVILHFPLKIGILPRE